MTAFDIAASGILLISALIGLWRGGVREIVSLTAFSVAALAAVFSLPLSAPLARHTVHPAWAAKIIAVIVVFLVVYIGLRMLGGAISAVLHRQATLGMLDRTAGLGLGLMRGLVALGGFYLVFNAATPPDLAPDWIVGGKLYPLSRLSGRALASVAPNGMQGVGGLGRVLKDRMSADDESQDGSGGANAVETAAPPITMQDNPYHAQPPRRGHRRMLVVQPDAVQVP